MKTHESISQDAVIRTVARYVGWEVSITDDFSEDVGLDSIDHVNLMTTVEEAHGVQLSDEEIASISNLRDLLRLLNAESGRDERTTTNRRNP